ncbi:MAG TPA: type II toxin-antitoxin system RelE/ParE family toxin [Candidatus Acidoferrum sp.]|jgi:mRNA-degrading endonuclease RelE of RelBE toxin-antitoxin system|nr:type II toxin-antitoxin system RelE/ParE family toxin [Candidatus Acidoferrum sp.]
MKKIDWSEDARADVRRIDRKMAMRIFTTIQRFAETGEGDVKELKGQSGERRLRVGDYRVRFTNEADETIRIHAVRHRREAYR